MRGHHNAPMTGFSKMLQFNPDRVCLSKCSTEMIGTQFDKAIYVVYIITGYLNVIIILIRSGEFNLSIAHSTVSPILVILSKILCYLFFHKYF